MQIQINAADPQTRHVDEEMVRSAVHQALGRFAERITRVEVHVKDVNGPKSGLDKHCMMEARLAGLDPMTVTAEAESLRSAVTAAARKLERVIDSDLAKRNPRR